MLAIARGMGETAPLLFTAATVNGLTYNLGQRMNSLPAQIFADISSPNNDIVQRAWASALVLVALVFVLTLVARLAQRRSRLS
jgi:phosphate transport system permease protein